MTFRNQYFLALGWIAILLILALLTPNPANAQRIEAGIGQTSYPTIPGMWYDPLSGPYKLSAKPHSWLLSLNTGRWKFSLVGLGSASSDALWGANEYNEEVKNPSLDRHSVMHGWGHGSVFGVSAGRNSERAAGPFVLSADGGLFLYRQTWHEDYQPLALGSAPGSMDSSSINLTPYAGAGIRYGFAVAGCRVYWRVLNSMVGDGRTTQCTAGVSIPFGGDK